MPADENDGYYEAYWPLAPRRRELRPLAPRLTTLAGKKIALLWDYLFRGDEVFALIEQELKARFPEVSFVGWSEFGNTHGNDEHKVIAALPAHLKELAVDAMISGMGC